MVTKKDICKFALLYCFASETIAGTGEKVEQWFTSMNYKNVTKAGVYSGQSANYATLGGVQTRSPIVDTFKFVTVQTPKLSAGCGGIDLYAGGFSAIDSDQFISNLRAVGQNAQSLAFMLAIQVVSPQLSTIMDKITKAGDFFNQMNMDSCQAATALMGGAMDMMGEEQGNCTITRMNKYGEDWNKANYACRNGGSKAATKQNNDPNQISFITGNLTWYVLMQDKSYQEDLDFSLLMMNLIGSVIIYDQDSNDSDSAIITRTIAPSINRKDRKQAFKNIYKALMHGEKADNALMIYTCSDKTKDSNACINISSSRERVETSFVGLYTKVETMVESILSKIYADEALSAEEEGLISSTTIPLYKYLTTLAAYLPSSLNGKHMASEYTQLIARDILLRGLSNVISNVEQQSYIMPNNTGTSESLIRFRKSLENVSIGIAELIEDNEITIEKYFAMQQKIQMYEKSLMSKLGSQMTTNAAWSQ